MALFNCACRSNGRVNSARHCCNDLHDGSLI
jgi:hypothetical protein